MLNFFKKFTKEPQIQFGAFDLQDPRDYKLEEIAGIGLSNNLPARFILARTPMFDQGSTFRCTIYSACHGINEMNRVEADGVGVGSQSEVLVPDEWVDEARLDGFGDNSNGWWITSPIKTFRKYGKVEGSARVQQTVLAIKQSIFAGKPPLSGTNKADWGLTIQANGQIVWGSGGGHALVAVGWDDNMNGGVIIYRNSWNICEFVYVKYTDLDKMFSHHALIDASDAPALWSYRAMKEGITTQGFETFRPTTLCSRQEAAMFISRARLVRPEDLYNGERNREPVTDYEVNVMLARSVGKPTTISGSSEPLQRWQVIKKIYART